MEDISACAQEEIEASGTDLILYRESIYVLATEVAAKASKKMYLVGPSSSGKSIAMATVVVQLRALGWLVSLLDVTMLDILSQEQLNRPVS